MEAISYAVFQTKLGWLGLAGTHDGISRIVLPQTSRDGVLMQLKPARARHDEKAFAGLIQRLMRYFDGKSVEFWDNLDLRQASEFQKAVWRAAQTIPYGQTRSYGWIARRIGKPSAARAVGQALGANPIPIIIPCHRVISGDGTLGGFSGGIDMKQALLDIERNSK